MHLICFVDQVSSDLVTPALDQQFGINSVSLLCEDATLSQAKHVARVLRNIGVGVVLLPLRPAWSCQSIHDSLRRIVALHKNRCLLNLSGGNSLQVAAGQIFASQNELPSFVIQPDTDRLLWLGDSPHTGPHSESEIADTLNLENYFVLFGHQFLEAHTRLSMRVRNKERIAKILLAVATSDPQLIRWLNRAGSELENGFVSTPLKSLVPASILTRLKALVEQTGMANWLDDHRIDFHDGATRAFLCGGWLEIAVLAEVAALAHEGLPIQDAASGVRIMSENGVHNEYDLALLVNNQLYLAECKTVLNHRQQSVGMDVLFKLDSVSQLDGLLAEAMLISLNLPSEAENLRAEAQDLEIVGGSQLKELRRHLREWVTKE